MDVEADLRLSLAHMSFCRFFRDAARVYAFFKYCHCDVLCTDACAVLLNLIYEEKTEKNDILSLHVYCVSLFLIAKFHPIMLARLCNLQPLHPLTGAYFILIFAVKQRSWVPPQ